MNWEPLVSERKSLTTKLGALKPTPLTSNLHALGISEKVKLMKSETLEGFFPGLLKKCIIMDLPSARSFYSEKGKITPPSAKSIKRISTKFKNILCCRSAILEIRNIPEK